VADADLLARAEDLLRRGEAAAAERLCRKALARAPRDAGALTLSGRAAAARGDRDEAVRRLAEARALAPGDAEPAYRLGHVLWDLFRYDDAAEALGAAARLAPARADAQRSLGHVLWNLWDYAGARERFALAQRLDPDDRTNVHNLLFCACFDPAVGPDALKALHAEWGPRYLARFGPPATAPHDNDPDPGRVLKVGYLSPDFRTHAVASFLGSIVAFHHPESVAAYCYASVARPDAVTAAFRKISPHWRDVHGLDDAAVAERIRADGIDVLVELAGYTKGNRLAVLAHRPAPVQVAYLGYPATTGLAPVDWRLSDAVANPPGTERFYTERLARVEGGFCCYLPRPDLPDPGPLPAGAAGHVTFGSFVNTTKVNPPTIALWARVLQAVPTARLLLFRHTLSAPASRERYLAEFERHGIGPGRVTIGWEVPSPAEGGTFGLYRRVDAVLDTLPFNGHTSTCEALWMGVPVLTLAGADFAGRLSAAVLRMAGLGGLAAATPDEFVALAAGLAADTERLANLRRALRSHMDRSRLADAAACTRSMEAAYRAMWRDWCARRGGGAG